MPWPSAAVTTERTVYDTSRAVMVSNHSRPTSISEDLRDFYLKQENGRKLLAGVKIIPDEETSSRGGPAQHEEVQ